MKKKMSSTLQFFVIGFLIAVFLNAIVSTSQILYAKDFAFIQKAQIFVFVLTRGALFFAGIYFLLYLLTMLFRGTNRGRLFWGLITIGMVSTVVIYLLFKSIFSVYTDQLKTIAAIAAFSLMISLASQYQVFIHPEGLDENLLTQE